MCGLEGRNNALRARENLGGFEGFGVGGRGVAGAAGIVQHGVLRADGGVVEAGGDGVRLRDLAGVVLEDVAVGPLQDAGQSTREPRSMFSQSSPAAAGFDADELDVALGDV